MFRTGMSKEVTNAVGTVYGNNGLAICKVLARSHPRLSEAQLLNRFRRDPCSNQTRFFRHASTLNLLGRLLGRSSKEVVDITQIGFSGQEIFSLALLGAANKQWQQNFRSNDKAYPSFRIRGVTVSPRVLDRAFGPFAVDHYDVAAIKSCVSMHAFNTHFEELADGRVRPNAALVDMIAGVTLHDIVEGPAPGEPSDVVGSFNMLWHYPLEARNHIMANTVANLQANGLFTFEGWTGDSRQAPGYFQWIGELPKYGLREESKFGNVYSYEPDSYWATKRFERSLAVEEALGVIVAAQANV